MKTALIGTITTALQRRHRSMPQRPVLRLRLLPLLIFVASLFLSVKVGLIWRETGNWFAGGAIAISGAEAKSASSAPAKPASEARASARQPAPAAGSDAKAAGEPPAATQSDQSTPAEPPSRASPEAASFSPAEVEVLRQLAGRRAQLDARARELDKRAAMLGAAERRLDAKAQALTALQAKVTALLKKHDTEEDAKMASLAKLYESMKPKDAAAILQTLELDTLLRVAERIKERKLAPIMAEMHPARARDMTVELARLRAIEPAANAGVPASRPERPQ